MLNVSVEFHKIIPDSTLACPAPAYHSKPVTTRASNRNFMQIAKGVLDAAIARGLTSPWKAKRPKCGFIRAFHFPLRFHSF